VVKSWASHIGQSRQRFLIALTSLRKKQLPKKQQFPRKSRC